MGREMKYINISLMRNTYAVHLYKFFFSENHPIHNTWKREVPLVHTHNTKGIRKEKSKDH